MIFIAIFVVLCLIAFTCLRPKIDGSLVTALVIISLASSIIGAVINCVAYSIQDKEYYVKVDTIKGNLTFHSYRLLPDEFRIGQTSWNLRNIDNYEVVIDTVSFLVEYENRIKWKYPNDPIFRDYHIDRSVGDPRRILHLDQKDYALYKTVLDSLEKRN